MRSKTSRQLSFYVGLFLITACTLMLQVIQTRIFSVVGWYYLAFFAISMAMFGLTVGAVWVYHGGPRFTATTLSYDLAYYSTAFAMATGLCLAIQMTLAPLTTRSIASVLTWLEVAVCLGIPFFFSGVVVILALTRSPFSIGRVYAADLVGAAAGCLGALLLLDHTDGPSAVLWVAALAAVGAVFFAMAALGTPPHPLPPLAGLLRHRSLVATILVVGAFLNGRGDYGLQPLVVKGQFERPGAHIFREWNTFSRVAVSPTRFATPELWGPSPKYSADRPVERRDLNIDGDAATTAFRFKGNLEELAFLKYDITNLAYHLPERRRAAVIGVGGGRDIFSAAVFGYRDITGIEINPIFVRLLTSERGFASFTGFHHLNGVKLIVDEGRSWFARSRHTFDIIQMSLVDTWAATGAGAFSLSENGLYTIEAWRQFLSRLTPRGVYTVSRWYQPEDPTETGRLLSLGVATLLELGVSEPKRHLFLATAGSLATLVIARQPLSAEDVSALDAAVAFYGYRVLVHPTLPSDSSILDAISTAHGRDALNASTSRQAFDLSPPTDDRPFFFNQLPASGIIKHLAVARELIIGGGVRSGNLLAIATLVVLFVISLGLVLMTIIVPLRSALHDVGGRLAAGGTVYFLLLGIGFMAVEIGLLQRMTVFLGHPTYALSVILFSLILATGVGSLLSEKYRLEGRAAVVAWAFLTGGYIASLPYWLSGLLMTFDGHSLETRAAVCVAIVVPAGVLMGFGFPTGMRRVSAIDRRPTPWFWGINGAAGVLASVAAVAISISWGITITLILGAICYVLLVPTVFIIGAPSAAPIDREPSSVGSTTIADDLVPQPTVMRWDRAGQL